MYSDGSAVDRWRGLAAKDGNMAHLVLPSGETRMVNSKCRATIGQLGNLELARVRWGKAGRKPPILGIRPTVSRSAMNPPRPPDGRGEGEEAAAGTPSALGQAFKGGRTRGRRKNSDN